MIGGNLRNHHRSRPAHSSDNWVRRLLRIQWGISRNITKRPYAIPKIEQGEVKPTVTACCGHPLPVWYANRTNRECSVQVRR
jgi:hypothetical protein